MKTPAIINIHGFRGPKKLSDYDEWLSYAKKLANSVSERITISDFLKRDQFIRNSRDANPEQKRVKNMIDDPLPNGGGLSSWKSSGQYNSAQQRREWGFQEKILQGYPEYEPDKIGYGDLSDKVIAGFVTVGDGIFSGIPSYSNILLDREETRRQIEYGYGRSTGREMIPTGLCFIQDDTAAIGLALGSDVRYTWHPRLYGTNLSNPSIAMVDDMHMGSVCIPKADYRQFLRVGDFVVIEIGMRMKYWHSLLGGSRPDYWETLAGYREIYNEFPQQKREDVELIFDGKSAEESMEFMKKYGSDSKNLPLVYRSLNNVPKVLGQEARFRDNPPNDSGQQVLDHPWSTGTPIPINSGMPYVLIEDFLVDSVDRVSPAPKVISAKNIRDLSGNGTNGGSDMKGMLVQLNNMRFVSPPRFKNNQRVAVTSDQSPGIYTGSNYTYGPSLIENINGIPQSVFIQENLNKLGLNFLTDIPASDWINYFWLNNGLPDGTTEFGRYLFDNPDILRKLQNGVIPDAESGKVYDLYNTADADSIWGVVRYDPITGKQIVPDIWKHELDSKYGVDFSGYKFELPKTTIRADLKPDFIDLGSSRGVYRFQDRWQPPNLDQTEPITTQRVGGDGWLYEVETFLGITTSETKVAGSWQEKLAPNDDESRNKFMNRFGLLEYKLDDGMFKFPISIDKTDGAYWFTNQNIPLPNAIESGPPEAQSTWLVSSTKVPTYIQRGGKDFRTVGDLSRGNLLSDSSYYYYYENNRDLQEQWNGNNLKPLGGGYFQPNRVYYLSDTDGVVVPIRINANTEIARFKIPIPTGPVDITGILWQYSMGTPGLEWEREAYIMQIWPRFLSDIKPIDSIGRSPNVPRTQTPVIQTPPVTNTPTMPPTMPPASPPNQFGNVNSIDDRITMPNSMRDL
jgi:hypothetical protein